MLFGKNEEINIMNWIGWLRQGYGLSTLLYNVFIDVVVSSKCTHTLIAGEVVVLGLLHADNLVVIVHNKWIAKHIKWNGKILW